MIRNWLASALVIGAMAVAAAGQTPATRDTFAALKFSNGDTKRPAAWYVEYVQYAGKPAFRIRAHHYHAWCNGYVYINPNAIAYVPELTPERKDGISLRRGDLQNVHPRYAGYEFSAGDKLYRFAFLTESDGNIGTSSGDQREQFMKFLASALSDFPAAQKQFLSVLAGVPAPADSSEALALPPQPVLRILDPAGALENVTTDASAAMQRVFGIAAAQGGIKQVLANDTQAKLTALSPEIVLFQSYGFPLAPGTNTFHLIATANSGAESALTFNATKPEVRIEPAWGTKTTDDSVAIKGLALGMHNLQRVGVNGKIVPLQKRPDGGFDFAVDHVPLNLGRNTITVFTVAANGQRESYDTMVMRVPPHPRLTYDVIVGGLKNHVPSSLLQQQVEDRGVDFELTPEQEKTLRRLGATDSLLDAINDAISR